MKQKNGRRTNAEIRKAAVEDVRRQDAEKTKVTRPVVLPPSKKMAPRKGFRNPKPREVEIPCCLDKPRPLPMVFKICPDCPKVTEAGYDHQVVAKTTEAESKPRRGRKKTEAVS